MDNDKKVLVVDDEIKITEVIKAFLESKGFIVYMAENAKEAFNIFEKENISLIILDLMLPDMSGEDICSIIRKKSRVPIIMLTAKIDEEDKLKGLAIGADDYMTKPFSLKELYARVDAVLRRSQDSLKPLYEKGCWRDNDLVINFQSHVVKKKNSEINLTPNEFKILVTLIKYPNKVFTRSELIVSALGDEYEGYDRVIDSHIKNIRQKVEDNPKEPLYLLTVHGVGYKFGGD